MIESPYRRSPALVISECQRGVIDPEISGMPSLAEQATERGIVDRIAGLAQEFRRVGLPVVHCTIEHRADMVGMRPNSMLAARAIKHGRMVAGTPDVEEPAPLVPEPADVISCRTTGLTAFYGTDLDAMLRLQQVETLVLVGVSTNVALPGLALEAVNRGYYVVVPEDCTAGASPETHEFMMENLLSMLARVTTAETTMDEVLPETI